MGDGRRRRRLAGRAAAVLLLWGLMSPHLAVSRLAGQTPEGYRGIEEKLPIKVAPQPVPFSHKQHAAAGMSCVDCHAGAATKERAGLPASDRCMLCHQTIATEREAVQRLADLAGKGRPIEWVRVYRVPDFVFFSHARHLGAGVECAACHGSVAEREVLAKEVSTSMTTCMGCHKAKGVSNNCHLCHELGQ